MAADAPRHRENRPFSREIRTRTARALPTTRRHNRNQGLRMNSRKINPAAGSLILALLIAVSAACHSRAEEPRPNIVLIISDDQGWTDFGFMGHPQIQTPHLDRLAKESALFPNAYVPTSLCRASLATLLTGQYGHQHRICCNDPPNGVDRNAMHPFIRQAPALPRLLGEVGYQSLQTGKFWEGHFSNAGFTHGMTVKGRHGDEGLAIGRETMQPIDDFLAASDGKPFLIWYAPMLPHEPHNPPERLLQKYRANDRHEKLAKYFAMCEWFDETVGQLLKKLDQAGLRETTVVMFTVDNGWIQETGPKQTTRGWFAPRSKLSPYDGGLRFPLMIRWPGHIPPARHETLVSSIDVVPTLLDAAGAKIPAQLPGISLIPEATGRGRTDRDAVFGEIFEHTATDLNHPALDLTHRWIRRDNWKLIVFEDSAHGPELYDLSRDPQEKVNLARDQPDRVSELAGQIEKWWAGKNSPAPDPAVDLRSELIFPPKHWHSHGSCLVECPNGDLLACWYQGSGERRADDVFVEGARKRAGQNAWTPPFVLADAPGFPDTNPCLFVDPQDRLWLFWQTILANEWHTALCRFKVSDDFQSADCPRWQRADDLVLRPGPEFAELVRRHDASIRSSLASTPDDQRRKLDEYLQERSRRAGDKFFSRLGWMTRVHPVALSEKRLVVPLYSDGYDFSIMAISEDCGETWHASAPLVSLGGVQPSLARRKNGSLVAYMRDNGPPPKRVLAAESADAGESWGPVDDTDIPNPGSGLELLVLKSGNWLLVNNDTEQGRHRLSVWISDDEGATWRWKRSVEDFPPGEESNTASYPSVIQARDGTIHLTYTYTLKGPDVPRDSEGRLLRETIKHLWFDEAWVQAGR